jgi:tetratricopeptide (TPR) repeat protein
MSGVFEGQPEVTASGDEAVAAGRDIGTAVTAPGAIGTQYVENLTFMAAPARPDSTPRAASVEAPPGLRNLPVRPRLFVGRQRELARLGAASATSDGPVVQVLYGLGGVGKSTLAAHWAADHAEHVPLWWITADSQAAVDAGLAALAAALEPALSGFMQQSQLRDWALQWLASHENWLVILDNVADPADVKPLLAGAGGRFLITSRRATGWHGIAETITLDVLTHDEAVGLFTLICPDAGTGAGAVCSELGCLPLAIEQAAAYCLETGTTADEYLTLLAEFPADMYTAAAEGGDVQRTVARVWRVTLDRLADNPLAVTILLALAWYAPDGIPRSLLDGLGSPPAVRGAVGRLAAHSMVTLRGPSTLSLHRLVQAVARTPDPEDPHRTAETVTRARDIAVEALLEALPASSDDPAVWATWRALLPHAEALAEHVPQDADSMDLARVFSRMGEFVGGQRALARARLLLARGESRLVRLLGPDHLVSLVARNRLMSLKSPALEEAVSHVARCERVLGPRHPETLTAQYELAGSHLGVDDHESAARVLERVVKLRGRVLGKWHSDTLRARQAAVYVQFLRGDTEAGARNLEQVYTDCVRELGERHPLTLEVRGLLTRVGGVGRHFLSTGARVALMFERGVDERDQAGNLMRQLHEEIGSGFAEEWARDSLADLEAHLGDCDAVLGREHNDTIWARLHLGQAHMQLGDFEAALPHVEQAAADADRYLDGNDVTTLLGYMSLLALALETRDRALGARVIDWFEAAAERYVSGRDPEAYVKLINSLEPVRELLAADESPALPSARTDPQ